MRLLSNLRIVRADWSISAVAIPVKADTAQFGVTRVNDPPNVLFEIAIGYHSYNILLNAFD